MTTAKQRMSPMPTPIVEMSKGMAIMSEPQGGGAQHPQQNAVSSGYSGPVVSMLGHLAGLGNDSKMQESL